MTLKELCPPIIQLLLFGFSMLNSRPEGFLRKKRSLRDSNLTITL